MNFSSMTGQASQSSNQGDESLISAAFHKAYPYSALMEISIQAFALILPIYLVVNSVVFGIVAAIPVLIIAYYAYLLGLMLGVGIFIRILPKPTNGLINSENQAFKYSLLAGLSGFIRRTPARWLSFMFPFPGYFFFRLAGAKVSWSTQLTGPDQLHEPYLISIGENTIIGFGSIISGHYGPKIGTAILGPVKIGNNVLVGRGSAIWCNVVIEDGATIQELSSVFPGSIIPAGEIWGGSPARKILTKPSEKPKISARINFVREITEQNLRVSIEEYFRESREVDLHIGDYRIPLITSGLIDSLSIFELYQHIETEFAINISTENISMYQVSLEEIIETILTNSKQTSKSHWDETSA